MSRHRIDPFTGRPRNAKPTPTHWNAAHGKTDVPLRSSMGFSDRRWRRFVSGQETIQGRRIA